MLILLQKYGNLVKLFLLEGAYDISITVLSLFDCF